MRYSDGQWRVIGARDRLKLCKTEGQVWLTLYQLLMDKDCQQKYEFNSHNKAVILKVHTQCHARNTVLNVIHVQRMEKNNFNFEKHVFFW